ncbi:membrane protein [Streptomyces capparidis]
MKQAVSLSILSADSDRDPDEQLGGTLPHEPSQQWVRPYRPGPCRVGVAALALVAASFLLFGALVTAMSGAVSAAGTILGCALALVAGTVRMLRVGIWVSDRGLRQVAPLRTVTLPWDRVAAVRTSQQPVRLLGLPRTVQGQAVLVTRSDGSVMTTLLTDHSADFLARPEAFDRAADAVEEWAVRAPRG